ncbi:MAG: NAD(P)H-dependent oxidoreductase subunit E [Candidatus Moraniibacteriota bacterium]
MTVEKILVSYDPEVQNLLPVLKKISADFGFIGDKDAEIIADYFDLSLAKIYEVASFYDLIKTEKPANLEIKVCSGGDCALGSSAEIIQEIESYFRIKAGDEFNPKVRLEKISCLGRCAEGPIMAVNGKIYEKVTVSGVYRILGEWS